MSRAVPRLDASRALAQMFYHHAATAGRDDAQESVGADRPREFDIQGGAERVAANAGVGRRTANFVLFVLWQMVLPFAPLWAELWVQDTISDRTWFIFLAVYAIALGSQSNVRLIFSAFIVIGLIYTFLYGWSFTQANAATSGTIRSDVAAGLTMFLFLVHFVERVCRHIVGKEPFMEFWG
jgi:hypothetical protein